MPGPGRVRQQLLRARRSHSGQQIILRNIVRSHGKDIHAVHLMGKLIPPLIGPGVHRHGAQADLPLPGIQNASVTAQQQGLHLVKRLLPVAIGPPQSGMHDGDAAVRGLAVHRTLGRGHRDCRRQLFLLPEHLQIHLEFQPHPVHLYSDTALRRLGHRHGKGLLHPALPGIDPAHMRAFVPLDHIDAVQPGAVYKLQAHPPENPGVRQPGTPVPAEHAVGLAQMGITGHGLVGPAGEHLLIFFFNISNRGMEQYPQGIAPHPGQLPDIVFPYPVHVLHMTQQRLPQIHFAQSVNPLKPQHNPVQGKHLFRDLQVRLIHKIILHQPGGIQFIIPVIGIRHLPLLQQSCIHGTRDPGLHPLLRDMIYILSQYLHSPVSTQINLLHDRLLFRFLSFRPFSRNIRSP